MHTTPNYAALRQTACRLRCEVLEMIAKAASGHPGGSLSMMEMLVALYYHTLRLNPQNPKDPLRDRFVLSKGHCAPALYAVLTDKGYFPKEELATFRQLGSRLQGHPDKNKLPGVDASTGSLGQGASVAVGMALGAKALGNGVRVYSILGDGELQEGLVWEAAMAAAHYKLGNLTFMVDNNNLQIDGTNDEVMSLGNIGAKFAAFGFAVQEVADGNDIEQVMKALEQPAGGRPKCIVAHTVKGSGVSFMENVCGWHGKAPSEKELEQALEDLRGGGSQWNG
ncbi:MAG: transketolase [Oscillospiraceae bacterium]